MIRFLFFLFVASVLGSIGNSLAGGRPKGCITSILVGLIGAIVGNWLSTELNIQDVWYFQENIPVLWTIVGSALFVTAVNLLSGNRR